MQVERAEHVAQTAFVGRGDAHLLRELLELVVEVDVDDVGGTVIGVVLPLLLGVAVAGDRGQGVAAVQVIGHLDTAAIQLGVDERGGIDRKSVVSGKSVSVRVDLGVSRIIHKKKKKNYESENLW